MKATYKSTLHACYLGYITQAVSVNLLALFFVIFKESFGISYTDIGVVVMLTFIIQIIVDGLMVKLTGLLGYRICAVAAHVFAAGGLILLGILPKIIAPYTGIIISMTFYSVGGGMTEVIISPIVDSIPGDGKASRMCFLHSFYSWGQMSVVLLSTLLLKFIGNANWNIIPMLWALIPLFNIFNFMRVPIPDISSEAKSTSVITYFKSPVLYMAVLLMICGGASEMAMSQWASLFAEQGLGVTKVVGDLLGPCLFAVYMGIGRIIYGIWGKKINLTAALLGCGVVTTTCYLTTVFSTVPFVSLLGCSLCGLGVSIMWPGILSLTSEKFGNISGPSLFAILALAGDVGCSLGPWVTGRVSDVYLSINTAASSSDALRSGLMAATAFPAVLIISSFVLLRTEARKKKL